MAKETQHKMPCSVKLWPHQLLEIDNACACLGVSRSRLFRDGALAVARELAAANGVPPVAL